MGTNICLVVPMESKSKDKKILYIERAYIELGGLWSFSNKTVPLSLPVPSPSRSLPPSPF